MKKLLVILILTISLIITTIILLILVDVLMHIFADVKLKFLTDGIITFFRYVLFAMVLVYDFFTVKILIKYLLISSRKTSQKSHFLISTTPLLFIYGVFCFCIKMFPVIKPDFYNYPDGVIYLPFLCIIIYLMFNQEKKICAVN